MPVWSGIAKPRARPATPPRPPRRQYRSQPSVAGCRLDQRQLGWCLAFGRRPCRRPPTADGQCRSEAQGRPPRCLYLGQRIGGLGIDIMQGQAAQALPEVERRLGQLAGWWRQQQDGQPVPEAPDPEFLARAYIAALDVAKDAHCAQEDWQAALPRIDAIIEVQRALRRPEADIAIARMNRANVLASLGRFGEARAELEACLPVFRDDPADAPRC